MLLSATIGCPARRATFYARNCSTGIRRGSSSDPISNGFRKATSSIRRNTLTTEPYVLWGLKAGYDDGKRFSAYVEGRNLGNRKYIASASIIDRANPGLPLFEPGTGLAVFGGVKFRIN